MIRAVHMRLIVGLAAIVLLAGGQDARADMDDPVVVELFTSQGCSSCPPADALLHKLALRDDVIALALHVDYWDYIGWKDDFARPEHTTRQKAYARVANARTIYTPQMVIGGVDHVIGARPMDVSDAILSHKANPMPIELVLRREGKVVHVSAPASAKAKGRYLIQMVRYRPSATVEIKRGENAGRKLTYSNIVTQWHNLTAWDGQGPLELAIEAPGDQPVVILVQTDRKGPGRIVAAAQLR